VIPAIQGFFENAKQKTIIEMRIMTHFCCSAKLLKMYLGMNEFGEH
jgi:hypothetical protein